MPTFGRTDTGNTADDLGLNNKQMTPFVAPENGTITKLTLYCRINAGTPVVKGVVYANSGGVPGSLLGVSNEATVSSSFAWLDLTGLNVNITAGTTYWLGYIVGDGGSDWVDDRYSSSGNVIRYGADTYADGPSDPAGSMTLSSPSELCIYATYTTGATLQTVTDSLSLSDSILRNKTLIIGDSVGAADSVKSDKTLRIADVVALVETMKALKTLMITDQIQLAESLDVLKGGILKSVTDAIGLADSVLVNRILALADSITLLDSASTPSRVLQALDAVGLADSAWVNKVLRISDTVSVAEVVVVGAGGVKKTRLFLVLGDLAVQLTGN